MYHQKLAGHSFLSFGFSGLRPRMDPRMTADWKSDSFDLRSRLCAYAVVLRRALVLNVPYVVPEIK